MDSIQAGAAPDQALLQLAAGTSSPVWLHLLLADRCNHSCQHCYQVQGLKGELTREQVEALLREFRAAGGFIVNLSGGEATLREDLVPILSYAHELGLATVLYTNGFTMTEALASAIAACHVWRVEISLYSHLAEEHDALTRVPGSWEKTTRGVRRLRAKGVNVILKFTPTALSTSSTEQLAALARELDANLFVAELVTAGEAGRIEPTHVRRSPALALAGGFSAALHDANSLAGKPCGAGDQLSVRADGRVQPCAQLDVPMAEVGEFGSLARAAESEVAAFFRDVTWADFPGCRECDLRAHCRRCFASAAAEVGDMLAPYRGACEVAVARYRQFAGNFAPIAAGEGCATDRDLSTGPYRVDMNGDLRTGNVHHSPYDQVLANRYPWLRPARSALQASARATDAAHGGPALVQLRRIGPR